MTSYKKLLPNNNHYVPWNDFLQFILINSNENTDGWFSELMYDGSGSYCALFGADEFACTETEFVNDYDPRWVWAKRYHETMELGTKTLYIFDT
jgi:hypothetical protein